MQYHFNEIEQKAQEFWQSKEVYKVGNNSDKPKFYVLDMFPYPSGAGLHVGHPLGYIASDIYARYKRMKGFNVLHPMGFDAFGLPAEQYAMETGQHPAITTEKNIAQYKKQLDNIGFCYDWSREINTSSPEYYKWTQWIFIQIFNSWYDARQQKTRPISELIQIFESSGNEGFVAPGNENLKFTSANWNSFTEEEKREALMQYRLAYLDFADVWWCAGLNTVLANDEIINGVSERGGFPVEKKKMRQWFLRITSFADRLLDSLSDLEWSEAMKEMQKNWIGKSEGASIYFQIQDRKEQIEVFTTRPDTIFGVDFMVLAPEHELTSLITTEKQGLEVEKYVAYVNSRNERERMMEKKISGCFTGAYAIHPISRKKIPIWISEYVLAGYGTGAIMAVPSGDERDHAFAKFFNIEITNIFGDLYNGEAAVSTKDVKIENSDFLSGLSFKDATIKILDYLENKNIGKPRVNYRLRDAGFSRQRYWGEPFPIVYKNDIPYAINEPELNLPEELCQLPLELPYAPDYKPGPEGEGPLANMQDWLNIKDKEGNILKRETNTMPGYAGSSWYFLRFMDSQNNQEFVNREVADYWKQVDLYIGGTEHAVGHLLYSRMWTKVLYDLNYISFDEPFKHLLNQGMIQGSSRFVFRVTGTETFVSAGLIHQYSSVDKMNVDVNIVDGVVLDLEAFKKSKNGNYANANFVLENGQYLCGVEIEKMSKSKYNVVNPDEIVYQYGADTFRMYEMFLGPVEMSKPWDTKGIEGVHRFLRKFWRLFYSDTEWLVNEEVASPDELKVLHKTIKKVEDDIIKFSLNTAVSQLMICVNELSDLKCHKKSILQPLLAVIAPFAPHISEILWQQLGENNSIVQADFPTFDPSYLVENTKLYPVAINGKSRVQMEFALDADPQYIEATVMGNEIVQKWIEGKAVKKFIYVKGRMINIVI